MVLTAFAAGMVLTAFAAGMVLTAFTAGMVLAATGMSMHGTGEVNHHLNHGMLC